MSYSDEEDTVKKLKEKYPNSFPKGLTSSQSNKVLSFEGSIRQEIKKEVPTINDSDIEKVIKILLDHAEFIP